MTEQEAILTAQSIFNSQDLYIMLSVKQADMTNGSSVPYIGAIENGEKILFVFTSYEKAKSYIDKIGYEILDNVYPIAKIDTEDKYRNFYQICNTAVNMGIHNIDIDPTTEGAFCCKILWMLNVNGKEPEQASILLSREEAESIMKNNNGQVPLRMNSMPVMNFTNPFKITEDRANELFQHIFNGGETVGDYMNNFYNNETIVENCFLCDYINSRFIPSVQEQGKKDDLAYFVQVSKILEKVIWNRVFEHKLYTITDKSTGKPTINNQSMYLMYTDRFKYTGNYIYQEISDKETVMKFIEENNIHRVVVTDGPNFIAVINEDVIA